MSDLNLVLYCAKRQRDQSPLYPSENRMVNYSLRRTKFLFYFSGILDKLLDESLKIKLNRFFCEMFWS